MSTTHTVTSESVSQGHPDKVCDYIADSILDACLEQDSYSQVACEVLAKDDQVVIAGEIATSARVDFDLVVREAIRTCGYEDPASRFHADKVRILNLLAVSEHGPACARDGTSTGAACDQSLVFGFATRETPSLLPLPLTLAHAITRTLDETRSSGKIPWLRPDAKALVTVAYDGGIPAGVTDIVVAVQHTPDTDLDEVRHVLATDLVPAALGEWFNPGVRLRINGAGPFVIGGPEGDCGVTGRKIIADTYGGCARHGGGAFSGKDGSKVDRSAAYFARLVARQIVARGLADTAEVQLAYAIGAAAPHALGVTTHGTGDDRIAETFLRQFDFRLPAIIERLGLRQPIYRSTTQYGHFGKPALEWEQ